MQTLFHASKYIILLLIYFFCSTVVKGQPDRHNPNIIYILADDLGYGDVNLQLDGLDRFNNPHVRTPNLARLARESIVFTHHYAADPICSPSRAGLLTGRVPTRMNIMRWISTHPPQGRQEAFLPGREVTIAEILKNIGYETAVFGKWHLNGERWENKSAWTGWTGSFPNQQGFDYAMVSKGNAHETQSGTINTQKDPGSYYLDTKIVHGKPLGIIKGFDSEILTDSALSWIKYKRDKKKPFFLYLPYSAVHEQVESPPAFNSLYHTGNAFKDRYYANITHLDAQIGVILDMLYAHELDENTILFFSSDNGPEILLTRRQTLYSYGTSAPLLGQKRQLFEGGIRVPGMIRWPGEIAPRISDLPNSTLDVLPTILEIVGMEGSLNGTLDGSSLLPHLLNNELIVRDKPLYWHTEVHNNWKVEGVGYNRRFDGHSRVEIPTPIVSMRDGSYVIRGFRKASDNEFSAPDLFQLYNIVDDRDELVELSKFELQRFERMKSDLLKMWRDVNADRNEMQADTENKVDQRK